MNIIKAIVDSLPGVCDSCLFCNDDWCPKYYCRIEGGQLSEHDRKNKRPAWCPLVTTEQVLHDLQSPFRNWDESEG